MAKKSVKKLLKPSSINAEDVEKFNAFGTSWWDESGAMRPLHQMNPIRLGYIKNQAQRWLNLETLQGLKILDVGCGGGLLCEPLARMGAEVTGIDAGKDNIVVAKNHAAQMKLKIDYHATTAEELAASGAKFDFVTALEIVEHVEHPEQFLIDCAKMVKPGGLLFVSTLNRTAKSFALGIVAAEYVLRLLPRGTHDWRKFMKPSEIASALEKAGMSINDITGLIYNPLTQSFRLDRNQVGVNYLCCFQED